ncbi:DUF2089 domain-containing protein [Halomicroarcula limicola]|uniref:DUF2089 domain-containing protein n=1 Tax=Haloarcula limicola TaxID=1429915 RepID=A0A8J7YEF5_9EURY|nr:hydrogenase maturation nickel metallochaperone HypA [Halomicroarcula limicola]MBV0924998.1 DUF2089 domain-containing protein [Halomicroarcula limicola]
MRLNFLRRLRAAFSRDDPASGQSSNSPDWATTALRTCPDCEKTFIVDEMDACPDCGTAVEVTPTERDLGLR